jgi:hypothetical protein
MLLISRDSEHLRRVVPERLGSWQLEGKQLIVAFGEARSIGGLRDS